MSPPCSMNELVHESTVAYWKTLDRIKVLRASDRFRLSEKASSDSLLHADMKAHTESDKQEARCLLLGLRQVVHTDRWILVPSVLKIPIGAFSPPCSR